MIAVIGENIVDMVAQADGNFHPHLGGSPFNVAIGLGKQEQACIYLSPLSQDAFGDQFYQHLQQHGVSYGLPQRSKHNSSLALVALDDKGQAKYSFYRAKVADRDISVNQLVSALPEHLRILHTGSLALEPEDLPVIVQVLGEARARGIKISVDVNVRINVMSNRSAYIAGIKQILPLCHYVKASDEDLLEIFPELNIPNAIREVTALMDDGIFAFTEGEKGAQLITRHQQVFSPVHPPETFGDTIGAGDTFYANFLARLLQLGVDRWPSGDINSDQLRDILRHAIVAASINVARRGCVPPTKAELEEVLARFH